MPDTASVQGVTVGAVAQMLPIAVGYGANLLAAPFVVNSLGITAFGVWAMTGAIAQYAALLDLGTSRAANRYVALFHARGDHHLAGSVVAVCVCVVLGIGSVLTLLAIAVGGSLDVVLRTGDSGLARQLALCSSIIVTSGLMARTLAAASFGRGRHIAGNVGLAVLGFNQVLGGVVALVLEPTLDRFAVGTAAGAVLGLCAVVVLVVADEGHLRMARPSLALAREILPFGVKGQAVGAADVVLFQSGKLIAGVLLGPSAAGALDLGIRLIQGAQAFGSVASVAITTHLTRIFATEGIYGVLKDYARFTERNAAAAIFPPFFLGATACSAVPLWLGAQHGTVVLVVTALSAGVAVNVATAVCASTMFAIGRSGLIATTAVVEASVSVPLAIALTRNLGFSGLVSSYATTLLVGNLVGVWFLQRAIGLPMKTFLVAIRGPFLIATIASAVALAINVLAAPSDRASAIGPFMVSGSVFVVIYVASATARGYWNSARGEK